MLSWRKAPGNPRPCEGWMFALILREASVQGGGAASVSVDNLDSFLTFVPEQGGRDKQEDNGRK